MQDKFECKSYLIKKIVLKVDYVQVTDFDVVDVVKEIRKQFFNDTYTIHQTSVSPEELSDLELSPEDSDSNIVEFLFCKGNLEIKFTRYYLVVKHIIKQDYHHYDKYISIIKSFMEPLIRITQICQIKNISYGTVDTLLFRDICKLNEYFDEQLFNYKNLTMTLSSDSENFINGKCNFLMKLNDNTNLELKTSIRRGKWYRSVSDDAIDAYEAVIVSDLFHETIVQQMSKLTEIMDALHDYSFEIYKKVLNDDFFEELKKGTCNRPEILGGINNV